MRAFSVFLLLACIVAGACAQRSDGEWDLREIDALMAQADADLVSIPEEERERDVVQERATISSSSSSSTPGWMIAVAVLSALAVVMGAILLVFSPCKGKAERSTPLMIFATLLLAAGVAGIIAVAVTATSSNGVAVTARAAARRPRGRSPAAVPAPCAPCCGGAQRQSAVCSRCVANGGRGALPCDPDNTWQTDNRPGCDPNYGRIQLVQPPIQYSSFKPGIEVSQFRVYNTDCVLVKVDLCSPGLVLRASSSVAETSRTTSQLAQIAQVDVAVNGDYFFARGRNRVPKGFAKGAGRRIPSVNYDNMAAPGVRKYDSFLAGPGRVEIVSRAQPFDESWVSDAVSGDITALNGQVTEHCSRMCSANMRAQGPRTVLGISGDRRFVFMLVSSGRSRQSVGLRCPEHASIMVQAGAASVIALDGGGSSMMFLKGRGRQIRPSDGSERVVGNFFGAFSSGPGASSCPA